MRVLLPDNPIQSSDIVEGAVLLVDKPLEWTSFDVVNKIRYSICKTLNRKKFKVGHAGTLDPLATGLLIVCTGKMTKQIESIMSEEKVYTGTIKLGFTTPSYDAETEEEFVSNHAGITLEKVMALAPTFTGAIDQFPPIYSAIKKDGKRLYESARKGQEVELTSRPVVIHALSFTNLSDGLLEFYVECSKGTYIRSLAHDIGQALGCGAYLKSLRREGSGNYQVRDAWALENLIETLKMMDPLPAEDQK